MIKRWTKSELEILRQNYGKVNMETLVELLPNRTVYTIRGKANSLKLTKPKKNKRKDIAFWSEAEDGIIKENYSMCTNEEMSGVLPKRTRLSIVSRASILGVKKQFVENESREDLWGKEEDEIIKTQYDLPQEELKELLPHHTWEAIKARIRKFGKDRFEFKLNGPIWTLAEDKIIKDNYAIASIDEMLESLPLRTWGAIRGRANKIEAERPCPFKKIQQTKVLDVLDILLKEQAKRDVRYNWIRSPKDRMLEIDGFYVESNLAVEFQGIQHCRYIPTYHRSKESFEYLQTCDDIKRKIIPKKRYRYLEILHSEPITEEHLRSRLEEVGIVL